MNLLETIDDELRFRHLSDFEKARYIYLRCCELFSFDIRWCYADITHDYKLKESIINKRIDIENVDSDLVICHNFNHCILERLIHEFTTLDCNSECVDDHSYLTMKHNEKTWKLDATTSSCDMARVKLSLPTVDFSGPSEYDNLILNEIDLNLGYSTLDTDYYYSLASDNSITDCIENVGYIIRDSKAKYHYSDVVFLYFLFLSQYCDKSYTCFDKDYNSHKLMEVASEYSFFDICKDAGEYKLKRITANEYKKLTKSLYRL